MKIFKIIQPLKAFCFTCLILVLPACVVAPSVTALSAEQRKLFNSGIYYFDANSSVLSGSCRGGMILTGSENAEKVFIYLVGKGLTPIQAAGIMGNIHVESGFNPRALEPSTTGDAPIPDRGYGIAQWTTPDRQEGLIKKAKEMGVPVYDLGAQLEYLYYESSQIRESRTYPGIKEWEGLKREVTVEAATFYWEHNFERPAVSRQQERVVLAEDYLAKYGSGSTAPSVSDSSTCASGSSGEVIGEYSLPVDKKWYLSNKDWFSKPHHTYAASDIPVPLNSPIYSITAGKVISAPVGGNCGNGLLIDAGSGVQVLYCHGMDGGSVVGAKNGDTVKAGQLIMRAGYTGRVVPAGPDGTHLHLEIRVGGVGVCPQELLIGIAEGTVPAIKSLESNGCIN